MSKSRKNNALTHGAHASEVLLWSEKYEDYEALRAGLELEHSPEGPTEHYLVRTLLDLLWRRRRLDVYEQIQTQQRLDSVRAENERAGHIENLKTWAPALKAGKSAEEVEAVLSQLAPLYRNTIESDYPLMADEDPTTWGARIASKLSSWIIPERHEAAEEFVKVMDLEKFDAHLERAERLDAAIDRIIKRLLQLKTQKQMHQRLEPKLINGCAAAAE